MVRAGPARVRTAAWTAAAACALLISCIPDEKAGFDEPGPSKRLEAIIQASGPDADPRSLPRLVEQLDSQDPAARMLAIRALENRTGETLGYVHTDPEWQRQEAIDRWMNYLETGGTD
jgi:hypothetical protein